MGRRAWNVLSGAAACLVPMLAAQGDDLLTNFAQDGAQATSDWRIEIAPYLWAVSLDGDAALRGGNGFAVDAPFTDTLDNSDSLIGLMGHFEVGRDQWSIFFEPVYSKVGIENINTLLGSADVEVTTSWYEFGGAWRLVDNPFDSDESRRYTVDVLGGVRYTDLGIDVDLDIGLGSDDDQSWAEPFIGARSSIDLADDWVLRLRGDVGGFGAGSDFAWQLAGVIGWEFDLFGADATLFAGYRALSQDYDDGPFEWDVIAHGPMIGLGLTY